jgi:hypothetical protein
MVYCNNTETNRNDNSRSRCSHNAVSAMHFSSEKENIFYKKYLNTNISSTLVAIVTVVTGDST